MHAKISVSDELRASFVATCRKVNSEFEGSWSQAKNAIAIRRMAISLGITLPDPTKEAEKHAKCMQLLCLGGNSSANGKALESKATKAAIAADYSKLA